jgi:hypothetical protein
MALRKMPDGSMLDTETGVLSNYDPAREAAGRDIAIRSGQRQAPPQPQQRFHPAPTGPTSVITHRGSPQTPVVLVPGPNGTQVPMIQPDPKVLALNPFELGLGAMSDTTKRMLLTGLIVAGAVGAVWLGNKLKKKSAAKSKED